jgi:porin
MCRRRLAVALAGWAVAAPCWAVPDALIPAPEPELPAPQSWIPVLELPRGWLPQGPIDPQIPWLHAGFRVTSQLIGNPTGGATQEVNLANGFDLTTSLGTDLMGRSPRRELDRWSANVHATGFVATGQYTQSLGFADTTFNPQSIFQKPGGVWLQSVRLERNEQPGHWLPSVQLGSLNLASVFFKPLAGNLYVSGLLNGHTGIEITGFPYGPLNSYGGRALLRFGRSEFSYGAFQLSSVRANPALRGWNQTAGAQDGLLHLLQWQQPLGSGSDGGSCGTNRLAAEAGTAHSPDSAQLPFRSRTGCLRTRLLQNRLPEPELRLGGFSGNWRFASINGPTQFGKAPSTATTSGTNTAGLFGYLALPGGALLGHRTRLWLSGSLGFMDAINPFPAYVAGGVVSQGLLPSRPMDLLLLGAANAAPSSAFAPSQASQSVIELGYQAQLSRRLSLQPFTQLLINAGGTLQRPLWSLGLQLEWNL